MKGTQMTESLFRAVKLMTAGGGTIPEIAEYFKISTTTVSRVRSAETYMEYRNMIAAICAKNKERRKEPEKAPEVQEVKPDRATVNYVNNRVFEMLREQNELLKLISNKLAFIVDQLV